MKDVAWHNQDWPKACDILQRKLHLSRCEPWDMRRILGFLIFFYLIYFDFLDFYFYFFDSWTFCDFLGFLKFLEIFCIFLGFFVQFFGNPFKVTKVTTKSYHDYYCTPKIAKNGPEQHNKLFICPKGKKSLGWSPPQELEVGYYPHWSRDLVSPIYMIFFLFLNIEV